MDLSSALAGLDRAQTIEVIHLLGRHLAEIRDREALRSIIAMDARGDNAVQSAVMKLAEEIEQVEGPIQTLDPQTRGRYLNQLDIAFREAVGVEGGDVGAALARLRQAS